MRVGMQLPIDHGHPLRQVGHPLVNIVNGLGGRRIHRHMAAALLVQVSQQLLGGLHLGVAPRHVQFVTERRLRLLDEILVGLGAFLSATLLVNRLWRRRRLLLFGGWGRGWFIVHRRRRLLLLLLSHVRKTRIGIRIDDYNPATATPLHLKNENV